MQSICRVVTAGVVLLLGACGGGGSGAGSEGTAGAGVQSAATLFNATHVPLGSGDRRRWRLSTAGTADTFTAEVIGAVVSVGGVQAFEVRDESLRVEYVARSATGVLSIPGPAADSLSRAVGSVELLRFGLAAGESALLLERTVSVDLDGDARPDAVTLRIDFSVVGFEDLATAAGRFTNVAHVRTSVRTVVAFSLGQSRTVDAVADEWYAPGIGRIHAVTATKAGASTIIETEDLVAYGVGAAKSESVAPQVTAMTPASGGAGAAPRSFTVSFSEPLDRQTFAAADGLKLLDAQGRVVSTYLSDAAYDGSSATLALDSALPEGLYTVHVGSAVVDWSNNAVTGADPAYTVDTSAPKLASSVPARDSDDVALNGLVSLTFNEDVLPFGSDAMFIEITAAGNLGVTQRLPATLSGRTLSASIAAPLSLNTLYTMSPSGGLADRAGNAVAGYAIQVPFRTDPGPLARPVALVSGSAVLVVRMGDLDGDGRADLVYSATSDVDRTSYLGIRPGLAGGGFGPPRRLVELDTSGACGAGAFVLGDFDGDGRQDVALACGPFLRVYLQTAPAVFVMERPGYNGSTGLGAADINGDGRAELVLVGTGPGQDVGGGSSWHVITRGAGGGWTRLQNVELGGEFGFPMGAVFADADNDGRADLVWVRRYQDGRNELAWAPRQGASFGAVQAWPVTGAGSGFMRSVTIGNLDSDGRVDAVIAGSFNDKPTILLVRGAAGGGFAQPEMVPTYSVPANVVFGDLNGDGRSDLVVGFSGLRAVAVHLQSAGGSFEPERRFELSVNDPSAAGSMWVLDVDGDGRRDLVVQRDVLLGRPFVGVWPAEAPRALAVPRTANGIMRATSGALMGR